MLRHEVDELEAADIPDRPPALRLEVRADGTVPRWDAEVEDSVATTLDPPGTAELGSDSWAAAQDLETDDIDYSVPLHYVESIDVTSPRGELRTVPWTCGPAPTDVRELSDIVEGAMARGTGGVRPE